MSIYKLFEREKIDTYKNNLSKFLKNHLNSVVHIMVTFKGIVSRKFAMLLLVPLEN
jgi:hypothetical protein